MTSLTSKTDFWKKTQMIQPCFKTPDMNSDIPTLEAWMSSLSDAEKLKAYHENFLPYAQKKEDELKKLRKWFERQLRSPLKRIFKQEVKRKQSSTAAKAKSGFNKSEELPKVLYDFLKKNISEDILKNAGKDIEIKKEMPRPKVTSLLVLYAKEKNCIDEKNKRIIHPDNNLRKLFGLKKSEDIDIFKGMQKMKAFYDKLRKKLDQNCKETNNKSNNKSNNKKTNKENKKQESSESELSSESESLSTQTQILMMKKKRKVQRKQRVKKTKSKAL